MTRIRLAPTFISAAGDKFESHKDAYRVRLPVGTWKEDRLHARDDNSLNKTSVAATQTGRRRLRTRTRESTSTRLGGVAQSYDRRDKRLINLKLELELGLLITYF